MDNESKKQQMFNSMKRKKKEVKIVRRIVMIITLIALIVIGVGGYSGYKYVNSALQQLIQMQLLKLRLKFRWALVSH